MVLLVTLPQNAGIDAKNLKERKMQKSAIEIRGIPAAVWGAARKRFISTLTGKAEAKMMRSFWLPSFASKAGRLLALTCPGTDRGGMSPLLTIRGALFWNFAKFYRMQRSAGKKSRYLPLA